jgi:hypothetical protein
MCSEGGFRSRDERKQAEKKEKTRSKLIRADCKENKNARSICVQEKKFRNIVS